MPQLGLCVHSLNHFPCSLPPQDIFLPVPSYFVPLSGGSESSRRRKLFGFHLNFHLPFNKRHIIRRHLNSDNTYSSTKNVLCVPKKHLQAGSACATADFNFISLSNGGSLRPFSECSPSIAGSAAVRLSPRKRLGQICLGDCLLLHVEREKDRKSFTTRATVKMSAELLPSSACVEEEEGGVSVRRVSHSSLRTFVRRTLEINCGDRTRRRRRRRRRRKWNNPELERGGGGGVRFPLLVIRDGNAMSPDSLQRGVLRAV